VLPGVRVEQSENDDPILCLSTGKVKN
jgi:hypothetical protein